ncbi:hypothetical protein JS565_03650 [Salmonella enterica subsp. enterica serovar Senftenberg]|nr:hypothetical protein [Salmonella enterica subsp. enterica serovar Senftenberg]
MKKAFELEMVVCADQFLQRNGTLISCCLLPPRFEEWNVDASYWHYWLSINQPAIKPMYEAKCDLEIATMLSRTINKMAPGSCTFPQEFDQALAGSGVQRRYGENVRHLFPGTICWTGQKAILPSSAARYDRKFKTPSGKYEFKSELAEKNGHTALPEYKPEAESKLPFHLFTPHVQFGLHSQFINPTDAGVLPGTVRLYPSFFRTKKASARTIWSKFSMAPVKLSCAAKVTTNAGRFSGDV